MQMMMIPNVADTMPTAKTANEKAASGKSAGEKASGDFMSHLNKAAESKPKDTSAVKPDQHEQDKSKLDDCKADADDKQDGSEAVVIATVPITVSEEQAPVQEPEMVSADLLLEVVEPELESLGHSALIEGATAEETQVIAEMPLMDALEGGELKEQPVEFVIPEDIAPEEQAVPQTKEQPAGETIVSEKSQMPEQTIKPVEAQTLNQQTQPLEPLEQDLIADEDKAQATFAAPEADDVQLTEQPLNRSVDVQQAGKTSELQQQAAVENSIEPEIPQIVRQALDETDVALKQGEAKNDVNIVNFKTAMDAQTETVNEVYAASDDEAGEETGKGNETTNSANQPITATIAQDGKVEFELARTQDVPQEQPQPQQLRQDVRFQVIEQVRAMVSESKTEFMLQLKPEHLGGLTILLSDDGKGIVAKMMTGSKDVHTMMQVEASQMLEALREKGINVVSMEVVYDQFSGATDKQDTNNGQGWESPKGNFNGSQGRVPDSTEDVMLTYDEMSTYDVLAEQGGSVEFTA